LAELSRPKYQMVVAITTFNTRARPSRTAFFSVYLIQSLLRLFGQGRDVVWWIVGIVFRQVPDMAAITAAAVVHLCVFAQSRKPLNMFRWTDRTSGVGHRGRVRENRFRRRSSHPARATPPS